MKKIMDFREFWKFLKVMEFDQNWEGSWKSHGILKLKQKVIEQSGNLTKKFCIFMDRRRKPFKIQVACTSIKRSWNFAIQSWKNHGILSRKFRGNPDWEITYNCKYDGNPITYVTRFYSSCFQRSDRCVYNDKQESRSSGSCDPGCSGAWRQTVTECGWAWCNVALSWSGRH